MALCKKYMDEVDAEWEVKIASEGDNKIDWLQREKDIN